MPDVEWADHVCATCGVTCWGVVGATECAKHGPMERAPDLCPERPRADLSACVRGVGHDGECVFVKGGRGARGHSLWFYQGGKAVLHADMRGERSTRREAAVLWAWLALRAARPARQDDG